MECVRLTRVGGSYRRRMTIAQSLEHSWIKVRWAGLLPFKDAMCDKGGRDPGEWAWVAEDMGCA